MIKTVLRVDNITNSVSYFPSMCQLQQSLGQLEPWFLASEARFIPLKSLQTIAFIYYFTCWNRFWETFIYKFLTFWPKTSFDIFIYCSTYSVKSDLVLITTGCALKSALSIRKCMTITTDPIIKSGKKSIPNEIGPIWSINSIRWSKFSRFWIDDDDNDDVVVVVAGEIHIVY